MKLRTAFLIIVAAIAAACHEPRDDHWEWHGIPNGAQDAVCQKQGDSGYYDCIDGGARYTCIVDPRHRVETGDAVVTPVQCVRTTPAPPNPEQ